jgi:hypothetical protein
MTDSNLTDPAAQAAPPPGRRLVRAQGMDYRTFLSGLHEAMLFDWYLEIGCRHGDTLVPVQSPTLAVDPFMRIRKNVVGNKPALHLFQETSDAFFARGYLARNDIRPSFSFLDGLHLFEYLLRDFRETEANSDPGGVIALHDCCPSTNEMTTRDLDAISDGAWTGDVWKLIPILQTWRPDLKLTVLDCAPTGLVLVSNLDPANRVLFDDYDAILRRFDVTLQKYGPLKFARSFAFADAAGYVAAGYPDFARVRRPVETALRPSRVST